MKLIRNFLNLEARLLLLAIALVGAVVISIFALAGSNKEADFIAKRNYWAIFQVETDYLRLVSALELYVAGSPEMTYERYRLALDIFFSRLDVLESLKIDNEYFADADRQVHVKLTAVAVRLDALTGVPDFRNAEEAQQAVALLKSEWLELHNWIREVINQDLIQRSKDLSSDQQMLIYFNILLLMVAVALILGVTRQARQQQLLARKERRTRIDAELAIQAQDRFLANMSHELRTPLNAIIGFSELLKTRIFGELNEKQDEYINDIHGSGKHLLSIVEDVLHFSKLEANSIVPVIKPCDLGAMIRNAGTYIEPSFITKGGTVDFLIEADAPRVMTDHRLMMQCLINLLSNAARHTPLDRRITVEFFMIKNQPSIIIADEGPGMTEAEIRKAFKPFTQFGDPMTTQNQGTGLGLAITAMICKALDVELVMKPRAEGGLMVCLHFPTDAVAHEEQPLDGEEENTGTPSGAHNQQTQNQQAGNEAGLSLISSSRTASAQPGSERPATEQSAGNLSGAGPLNAGQPRPDGTTSAGQDDTSTRLDRMNSNLASSGPAEQQGRTARTGEAEAPRISADSAREQPGRDSAHDNQNEDTPPPSLQQAGRL
ncbi:sensor histidine kinase [Kiloniella sp. b19]|uniref:sensor histidine kinase n=1 Tax=Kiloniella sp. GXU_MW_B19 TaxID=3141326 RepID=UPI0031D83180